MKTNIYFLLAKLFDKLQNYWEGRKNHRIVGSILVASFVLSLLFSLLDYLEVLPPEIAKIGTANRYFAIHVAFTLLLISEIIGLVFALARSVSSSLLKQFEIFSLILLRSAFKHFGELVPTTDWSITMEPILAMLTDAFGALIIFVIILAISKIQKHNPITSDPTDQTRFVLFKKSSAILLIVLFVVSGITDIVFYFRNEELFDFFTNFYNILIFNDILLVLISLRYNNSFLVVFRNSAFAVATLIIRMALTAPPYFNAILGILGTLFGLGVVYFYNKYASISLEDKT